MSWVESMRDIILGSSGLVVAVGAVLFFVKQWIISPLNQNIDHRVESGVKKGTEPILLKLEELAEQIRDIRYEVNYNGGRSLKDAVRNTQMSVTKLSTKFDIYIGDTERDTGNDSADE